MKIRQRLWSSFMLCWIVVFYAQAQQSSSLANKLDQVTTQFAQYNKFGGVVLVSKGDKIIYQKSFGQANQSWQQANTLDTRFQIGSVTKSFTALLVLQQVAQGKIELNQTIDHYFPDYPKEVAQKITVHHLLSHTSGMPHYRAFKNYRKTLLPLEYSKQAYVDKFKNKPLRFEPGKRFGYSSFGYYLLGIILEKVTQKTYNQLLQENIFNPAQMTHSSMDDGFIKTKQATAYRYNFNQGKYAHAEYRHPSTSYSTGGIFSTARDLFRFQRHLLQGKLLPSKYQQLLFKVNKAPYGYGWLIYEFKDSQGKTTKMIHHNGAVSGYTANLRLFPKQGYSIVILSNTRGYKSGYLPVYITRVLYGKEVSITAPLWGDVYTKAYQKGAQAAIDFYNQQKKSSPNKYNFEDSDIMHRVAYRLNQRPQIARQIFEFNIQLFPQKASVVEDMARFYQRTNNPQKAIEFYKKCIAMEPTEKRKKVLEALNKRHRLEKD